MAARMMLRPMRPNPLIPTLIAMRDSSRSRSSAPNRQMLLQAGRRRPCSRRLLGVEFRDVHALYTLAIVLLAIVLSPWFLYQAIRHRKYIGNLAQRMGYLPVSFNLDGDEDRKSTRLNSSHSQISYAV